MKNTDILTLKQQVIEEIKKELLEKNELSFKPTEDPQRSIQNQIFQEAKEFQQVKI